MTFQRFPFLKFTDSIKSSEMELVQMENKNEVAREEIRALVAEKERAASKHALKLEEKTKAQQKLVRIETMILIQSSF